jgi:hypothetical protein
MWNVWQWAVASNERAVANARMAAVDCSRRLLEHAEVEDYLATRYAQVLELRQLEELPRRVNQR